MILTLYVNEHGEILPANKWYCLDFGNPGEIHIPTIEKFDLGVQYYYENRIIRYFRQDILFPGPYSWPYIEGFVKGYYNCKEKN